MMIIKSEILIRASCFRELKIYQKSKRKEYKLLKLPKKEKLNIMKINLQIHVYSQENSDKSVWSNHIDTSSVWSFDSSYIK